MGLIQPVLSVPEIVILLLWPRGRKSTYTITGSEAFHFDMEGVVEDKNMVPLKVAILAAFLFYRYSSCPEPRTRTVPIAVKDKNLFRLPIR
ncbi:hypothetical protein [Paenibacillus lentus]|uniref:hypothetical protein n=1 Tax=Paenibacillus lentus TaxID=1338368 RepID=UPI0036D32C1C